MEFPGKLVDVNVRAPKLGTVDIDDFRDILGKEILRRIPKNMPVTTENLRLLEDIANFEIYKCPQIIIDANGREVTGAQVQYRSATNTINIELLTTGE